MSQFDHAATGVYHPGYCATGRHPSQHAALVLLVCHKAQRDCKVSPLSRHHYRYMWGLDPWFSITAPVLQCALSKDTVPNCDELR